MNNEMRKIWNSKRAKQILDVRNIALYVFCIVALAITWSGVKTVQANYVLQKKVSELQQQNSVITLQNENTTLQNKYLQTDDYLDLSARQNLGLAAPGEKIMIVPKATAMKYVDASLVSHQANKSVASANKRSQYAKNLEAWRDFLLGRQQQSNN
jgi:cell division protein FtsB